MASEIKIYKIKDFIRKTETGEIDFDRSRKIIYELVIAASYHADHNILMDLRETTIIPGNIGEILELSIEMARYKSAFKNKIASVIPDDDDRLAIARQFKACLNLEGFQYDFFTNFEDAIEWLSEATQLNSTSNS